jgi:hypothetical protein
MSRSRVFIMGVALLVTVGALQAQVTQKTEKVKGAPKVATEQLTGEVVWVQGNTLVAKMQPRGYYSVFNVKPGREFLIDGQTKHIGDLQPGTVLTATVTTTTRPVTVRTTSNLKGKVWWKAPLENFVILTLENGQNKGYNVPANIKFNVDGKPASISELKEGMNVSVTKIVEEPYTELAEKTVVTGKAPK